MNLKELQEDLKNDAKIAGITYDISLYECAVDKDTEYLYEQKLDNEEIDRSEYDLIIKLRDDFFDKHKMSQVSYFNTGNYGDPYYHVNIVYKTDKDLHFKISYQYDSYDSNEYNENWISEVTPVQEVKIRFR